MKKLLIIITLLCASSLAARCPEQSIEAKDKFIFMAEKQIFEKVIYSQSLTTSLLIRALYYSGIKEPEIVYKQAIIETGWFTSDLFLEANNIFGMRLPRIRETTAVGEYEYHAMYQHWYDSVKDYRMLQDYYLNRGYSLNEYLVFLKDIGYATDPLYISKIKSIRDAT